MKKLLAILVLGLLLIGNAYAKTIHLTCENVITKKSNTILSLTEELATGFEHYSSGDIVYKLKISNEFYSFSNEKENRYWNINRYTGFSTLKWKSSDGMQRVVNFNCDIAKKKKF